MYEISVNCMVIRQKTLLGAPWGCAIVFLPVKIQIQNQIQIQIDMKLLSIAWLSDKTVLGAFSGCARVFSSVYLNRISHDSECTPAKSIEFEPDKPFQTDSSQRVSIRNRSPRKIQCFFHRSWFLSSTKISPRQFHQGHALTLSRTLNCICEYSDDFCQNC